MHHMEVHGIVDSHRIMVRLGMPSRDDDTDNSDQGPIGRLALSLSSQFVPRQGRHVSLSRGTRGRHEFY